MGWQDTSGIKMLAAKTIVLCSITWTHMVEEGNHFPPVVLWPPHVCCGMSGSPHIHIQTQKYVHRQTEMNNKCKKMNKILKKTSIGQGLTIKAQKHYVGKDLLQPRESVLFISCWSSQGCLFRHWSTQIYVFSYWRQMIYL